MPGANDHMSLTTAEQDKLTSELDAVVDWIADALEAAVTQQSVQPSGPRGRRAKRGATEDDSTLPFNEPASDVTRDFAETLNVWVTHIADARKFVHPGRLDIVQAAKYLRTRRYVTGLSLTDEGAMGYEEILYAIERARRTVDRRSHPTYAGSCPKCKGDLWARRTDEEITCTKCDDVVITREDNDTRIAAEIVDRLFTVVELVPIAEARLGLTIKPKTIHNLARYRIAAKGEDRHGQPLYRCGDVLDALAAQQEKPKPKPRRAAKSG